MDKNSKNILEIAVFLLLAGVIVVICLIAVRSGEEGKAPENEYTVSVTDAVVTEKEDKSEDKASSETEETEPEVTEVHISPTKLEGAEMIGEVTDIEGVLIRGGKDDDKKIKIPLKELALSGDILESFTFYIHAEDGKTILGELKTGYGISVYNSCESKTSDIWYQDAKEYIVMQDGTECSVTWQVPDEIKDYINIPTGDVQFGYWWSDSVKIVLDRVVCHRKTIREIPVDGEKTVSSGKILKPSSGNNLLSVPMSEFIEEGQEIECVEITFEGNEAVTELMGKFGVDTKVLSDGHYDVVSIIVSSEDNTVSVKWLPTDVVKKGMALSGNIDFVLERCSLPEITVKDITVQYAVK